MRWVPRTLCVEMHVPVMYLLKRSMHLKERVNELKYAMVMETIKGTGSVMLMGILFGFLQKCW